MSNNDNGLYFLLIYIMMMLSTCESCDTNRRIQNIEREVSRCH